MNASVNKDVLSKIGGWWQYASTALFLHMKKTFLTFLDIDETLIKENQRPNSKRLPAVVQKLEKKGFIFGLNSNRSFEDIQSVYNEFGLNGPVVLENGVYFKKTITSRKTFLFSERTHVRAELVRASKDFAVSKSLDARVESMDTVAAIAAHKKTKGAVIMINKFRLFTGSIHVYRDGVRDRELAAKLATHLKKHFRTAGKDIEVLLTGLFGNIIVYPRGTSKTTAFKTSCFLPRPHICYDR